MTDSPPPAAPLPETAADRLDSWKEIAAYLRRDVTTVQRWERRENMPVHRHVHDKLGSVYAFRSELDSWMRSRRQGGEAAAEVAADERTELVGAVPPVTPALAPATPSAGGSSPGRPSRRRMLQLGMAGIAALGVVGWRIGWRRDPGDDLLADAILEPLTNFGGKSHAAAISPDGSHAAFLSDHDGRMAVWVTRIGTNVFQPRTRNFERELSNPDVRAVGFTPDGAHVTFWARGPGGRDDIDTWAVPVLGGEPRQYEGGRVAEYDWCRDGRLVYHRPDDGDPTYVRDAPGTSGDRLVYQAPAQQHSHFPRWSPDCSWIYFVQGQPGGRSAARMDIWRIAADGGRPEQLTYHDTYVAYPVFVGNRTLLYVANDAAGGGPFIHSLDVQRGAPRPLYVSGGLERVTSLAASANGGRLVATLARSSGTLWRVQLRPERPAPERLILTTGNGASPRLVADSLLYVASHGTGDSIWMVHDAAAKEIWPVRDARVVGGPAISRDGRLIGFVARRRGRATLWVGRLDGTDMRAVPTSIVPEGAPAWAPDGTVTVGGLVDGVPRLFSIEVDRGRAVRLIDGHARDPVWSPDGTLVVYSGADVGTTFPLHAAAPDGSPRRLPPITLTRGARRLVFLPNAPRTLGVLRGAISRKNLVSIDLDTGREEQMTELPGDFDVRDFDISPDGGSLVVEQQHERSEIVLIDRRRQNRDAATLG